MNSLKLILSNWKYFAPVWVFASLNILTGTWVLYIPHLKNKFSLNDGEVGLALFNLALGLLVSIPVIPYINKRFGVGRSTLIGVILFALLFNLPISANAYWVLCAGLFLTGIFSGFTDVSMNALISEIETRDQEHIMSAAHGFFSLGGFIGASVGSVFLASFSSPETHMLIASSVIIITNLLLSKYYYGIHAKEIEKDKDSSGLNHLKPLLGLAVVAFIVMCSEGAVEHWSNLFLFDIVHVSESKAGLGFIAFSLCMTLGRFLGDGISKQLGSLRMISYGCVVAFIAYFLIVSSNFYFTILGFGVLGLGLSVIIPELFRMAGQTKGIPASEGISLVTGIGFLGFLIGPVLLGFISNWTNLIFSFLFLASMILIAFCLILFHFKNQKV